MTYTEAASINQSIKSQKFLFKDPKKLADGGNEQWGKLEDGRYGIVKGCRTSDMMVLVAIPVQSLKNHYRLVFEHMSADQWTEARRRFCSHAT